MYHTQYCAIHSIHSFAVTYVTVGLRRATLHRAQYLDIEITMRVVVIYIKRYLNGWGILYISRLQNNSLRGMYKKKFIIFSVFLYPSNLKLRS